MLAFHAVNPLKDRSNSVWSKAIHALSGLKAALGLKDLVQVTNVVDNID